MVDADMVCRELDQVRTKLELTIAEADREFQAATDRRRRPRGPRVGNPNGHRNRRLNLSLRWRRQAALFAVGVRIRADFVDLSAIDPFQQSVTAAAQDVG